jgi:alpha/beta superfamily hydrolase
MSICPAIPAMKCIVPWLAAFVYCATPGLNGMAKAQEIISETACDGIAMSWLPDASNASAPAVILVPGHGPFDRHGDMPGSKFHTALFLGIGLQKAGISSLNFDKRGIGKSNVGNGKSWDNSTIVDEARDVECLVNWVRENHASSRITLVGFDAGGVVAALAATTVPVDGIVMLPAFESSVEDMLEDVRREGLSAAAVREIGQAVAARLKGEAANYSHPILHRTVDDIVRRTITVPPPLNRVDLVARLKLPILLIDAGWDFGSSRRQIKKLEETAFQATTFTVADMNNHLRLNARECPKTCQDQRDATGISLEPRALVAIATFARCGSIVADSNACRPATTPSLPGPGR